ncbi:hypothetical protein BOQ62_07030 [Chryseobacterium sp. CH21]|nr:hypothetical protein BOQ62_07030 [Chryseobacterium sp. CH21]
MNHSIRDKKSSEIYLISELFYAGSWMNEAGSHICVFRIIDIYIQFYINPATLCHSECNIVK